MEKNELNCLNCGAPLRRGASRCEYCGTLYKGVQDDVPVFRESIPHTQTLAFAVRIEKPSLLKCRDEAIKYAKLKIASGLAKQIMDYVEFDTMDDYASFCEIIKGRVTIVAPQQADFESIKKMDELHERVVRSYVSSMFHR